MVRINLYCEEIGDRPVRIRELMRQQEMGKELVWYAGIFCAMTTIACSYWLIRVWA